MKFANKEQLQAVWRKTLTKMEDLREDIEGKIPTKLSAFDNDVGYIKAGEHQGGSDFDVDQVKAEILAEVKNEAVQRTPLFANSIEELKISGDTSKVYILPDGQIYGYMYSVPTKNIEIEMKSGGFWQVYESGTGDGNTNVDWVEAAGYDSWRSNMIPVNEGDTFNYSGRGEWNVPSVVWYSDTKFTNIEGREFYKIISYEQIIGSAAYTAPAGAKYAEFCSYMDEMSVTYVSGEKTWQWTDTGHAFVPADYEDRILTLETETGGLQEKINKTVNELSSTLKGKKIVYDGDSIAESRLSYAANGGGYAKLIADRVGGTYVNRAVSGGRLRTQAGSSDSFHSVVDNIKNLPVDGDLYCFEGGINDFWTYGVLGTFDYTDFDGELDTTTVCGALEAIFRYAISNFAGKPVCFIITHKIQETAYSKNRNGNTFKEYRDAMAGICNKYSIPYYDAFSESGLNGWNNTHSNLFLTANTEGTPDGCHPNEEGYKKYYVPQLISLFERIMPED